MNIEGKLKEHEENFNSIYEIFLNPPSVTCKRTGMQMCHICDREDCCDNDNPLVKRIKELEKKLEWYEVRYWR